MANIDSYAGVLAETVRSEFLCFAKGKCKTLTFDALVKICSDFYTEQEILSAKELIECSLSDRMPKRRGPDSCKSTVEDIIRACLNPNVALPTYYAADIARLPPVSTAHCDMSAVLQELQSVRSEVREIGSLRQEVDRLKQELMSLKASVEVSCTNDVQAAAAGVPVESAQRDTSDVMQEASFARLARQLRSAPSAFQNRLEQKPLRARKLVVGVSVENKRVKAVTTTRTVDIFVSHLHPETHVNELKDCVHSIKGDITVFDVECLKLTSKFESLYSSFHVAVKVDSADFSRAVDVFMSANAWPAGVFVKRYFRPKNVRTHE